MTRSKKMDRRSVMSRRLLGEALLELIAAKSFDEITIKEIADTADLNRGTFYLHYTSKEELLFDLLSERFEKLVAQIDEMDAQMLTKPIYETPFPDILVFNHVQENADLYRYVMGESGMGVIINQIIDYIAFVIVRITEPRLVDVEPTVPIEIIARHVAGSMYAQIVWWLNNDFPYSAEEMASMGHELALNGCFTPLRGRAFLVDQAEPMQ